jgi:hypothetical protein
MRTTGFTFIIGSFVNIKHLLHSGNKMTVLLLRYYPTFDPPRMTFLAVWLPLRVFSINDSLSSFVKITLYCTISVWGIDIKNTLRHTIVAMTLVMKSEQNNSENTSLFVHSQHIVYLISKTSSKR